MIAFERPWLDSPMPNERHPIVKRRQLFQWAFAASTAASLSGTSNGCTRPCPPAFGQWNNAVGSLGIRPSLLMFPTSPAEIVAVVQQAETSGKRIRMTGSGHSFSDVALTDDYLLLPNRVDGLLAIDRAQLKPGFAEDAHLVRVESGITIRKLNAELDSRGLALENLGGYDGQTVAGVMMTATHGSGLRYGPIVSQVASLQIVCAGGEMLQIEPAQGMTDPAKFPGFLPEDPRIKVRLVQNDDWFDAVTVSMGCMGIVYAVVVRSVDKFWIREQRSLVGWSTLTKPDGPIERLIRGKKLKDDERDPDHYEIYVNPYATRRLHPRLDHTCIVTERYRFSTPPPPTPENTVRGRGGTGNLLANPATLHLAENVLRQILDDSRGDALYGFHDGLLDYLEDDDYTDVSYRVFNLGDANRFRAYGIEMAFGIEQTVAATERLFQLAAWHETKNRHHSVPVSLRFVAPARAHLAMQFGRPTCMMEIGALVAAHGAAELLRSYEETYLREFDARPHWGLDLNVLSKEASVARLYPAWPKWKSVYAELNKRGTFNGRTTDRLGISIAQR